VPHKTDGSHTNRPFFRSKQDVRESIFSQIDHLSRSVFCFFSSRKEIVPLLFFLEEKKQKKINCGAAFLLHSCRFRQRAAQNGRFTYEPSVFRSEQNMRESVFPRRTSSPAMSFVSFLQEKKSFPFFSF